MIFPTIVEECNPAIHGLPDEAHRSALVRSIAHMMPAEPQRRDLHLMAAELAQRNRITSIRHGVLPSSIQIRATGPPLVGLCSKTTCFAISAHRVENCSSGLQCQPLLNFPQVFRVEPNICRAGNAVYLVRTADSNDRGSDSRIQ